MPDQSVIVWDLETVPDLAGFAAANDLGAPSSEASLARIWGLGAHRAGKSTVVASIVRLPQSSADDGAIAMGNLRADDAREEAD